jgi:hypothetical protein
MTSSYLLLSATRKTEALAFIHYQCISSAALQQ